VDNPNHQTCHRCYTREHIPTHQFVKFDTRVHYLCLRCWEAFRTWYHWGRRPALPAEKQV
jgi:hypothetical protein